MQAKQRKKSVWNKQRITKEKQRAKEYLDSVSVASRPVVRLKAGLKQIEELGTVETELSQLRRFIYVVSVLFHHAKFGGLKDPQVRRLISLAEAILRTRGIRETTSKLAFLFGELHLSISQIHRREGSHWKAAWDQQVAEYLSYRTPAGGKGFQRMANALRSLRLGHAGLALEEARQAIELGVPPASEWRLRLEQVRAYRLSGDWNSALRVIQECENSNHSNVGIRLEFQWERLLIGAMETGKLEPLFEVVRKGRSHHQYGYILELFLWTRSVQSREWMERFPRAKYIALNQRLDPLVERELYRCVEVLEQCYQFEIPFLVRLQKMPTLMDQAKRLPSVDRELLIWAATARWLARTKSPKLAALVLAEYHALNLKLTGGLNRDIFGLMQDLAEKPWYQGAATHKHLESLEKIA